MKLVLLHSPLVASSTWNALAPLLRAGGHVVVVPDLVPVMLDQAPYYTRLARTAADAIGASHESTILVVHSGAGALVPAIAECAPIGGAIFVDALLPYPGQCWFDTTPQALNDRVRALARDGILPPWHRWWPEAGLRALLPVPEMYEAFAADLPPLPLAYFEEIAPDVALKTSSAYLQIGEMNQAEADWAQAQGWPVARRKLHHLAMLTHPAEIAVEIERLAATV